MMGKFVFWVGVIALIWLGFRLFQVLKRKSQQQQQTSGSSGQERSAPGTTAPGAGPPPSADALEVHLQALEQEKNQLLSQRGQVEQRCQSLGAVNPQAELEQRQAAWEEAQAERQRLE
ncbi:MAG: hypothetical protein EBT64_02570, partial [Gammaproteobacteria bacterium]|nr:hypothetical protein [Gammaproteobacteria bacterium]